MPPLLSVAVITYNHEKYIAQMIESVLRQKTNFPIELVIGEDNSTDKTRKICLSYQEKYPEIVKVLCPEKNLGAHENFVVTFNQCQGKYTAICEGDDYWTDDLKLQKQVDFLEENPDYAICFHNVKVIYEDENRQPHSVHETPPKDASEFEDLAKENYIPTVSSVFRTDFFKGYPNWYYEMSLGDWILHLLVAQYGKIKYLDETMGVYRIHGQGSWGSNSIQKRIFDSIRVLEKSREHFYPRGNAEFTETLERNYKNLANSLFPLFDSGDYENFRHYFKIVKAASIVSRRTMRALTIRYFLSFVRGFYKKSKSLKR